MIAMIAMIALLLLLIWMLAKQTTASQRFKAEVVFLRPCHDV